MVACESPKLHGLGSNPSTPAKDTNSKLQKV